MESARPRIVSLLPSATEIVAALGLSDHLVGRSHECDYPPGIEALPVCSAPRIPTGGTSTEIDQRVQSLLAEGISMYQVDEARLRRLQPDFILTQTQCAVCAVTPADLEAAVNARIDSQPVTLSLEPNDLADVFGDMRRVGEALGVPAAGQELADRQMARLESMRRDSATLARPTVVALEWTSPLMAGGNWMPELIEIAGGESLLGEAGAHSPVLEWETLASADPDVILLMPCGFTLSRSIEDIQTLRNNPRWRELAAVKNGQVYIIDGHHYFNRPGPRLVESAEMVAEILHPGRFHYGHHGDGWLMADETPPAPARGSGAMAEGRNQA